MTAYLKVTSRGTIQAGNRQMITPGTRLTKDQCSEMFGGAKEIDRLVEQGYLVRLGDQTDPEDHPLPPQTNTVQQSHPHPHEVDLNKGERAMKTAGKDVVATPPPVVTSGRGPWTFNPDILTGKDVIELNVMIAERTVAPNPVQEFETPEEAVAWLSQDYIAADAPAVATG